MKQKEVFKKIGGIIQELSEQYEYLETVVDNLNDLELELFVSNAHFLTDHIEILCKLNLQNKPKRGAVEKPEVTTYQQKFFEPVVQQMKPGIDLKPIKTPAKAVEIEVTGSQSDPERSLSAKDDKLFEPIVNKNDKPEKLEDRPKEQPVVAEEKPVAIPAKEEKKQEEHIVPQFDFTSNIPEDSYSVIQEQPETIRHELVLDEAETWEDEEETKVEDKGKLEKEKEEKSVVNEVPVIPEVIEEKPEPVKQEEKVEVKGPAKEEDEVITRNQKISSQLGDKASKSDQLSVKPISDIKLAITLNDKLLYVKDLFNGYNLAYSEAIEILNRFNTFEEAQRFLKTNYVTKNNWEGKQATADKFYALLKRRYA